MTAQTTKNYIQHVPTYIDEKNRDHQALLDVMRETVLYFDRWGLVRQANLRAKNWLPDIQVAGLTFIELLPQWDDPAERQRELMQVIRSGLPVWGSKERAFEDGGERWYSVDKIPTTNEASDVVGVMLVMSDVTESVLRERALRESESRYKAYIANSAEAIWRYDLCPPIDINIPVDDQVNQIIERAVLSECNDRLAWLYGLKFAHELLGQSVLRKGSVKHQQDLDFFVRNGYKFENRESHRTLGTGKRMYLQTNAIGIVENGYLIRAWGTTRDVTENKRYLERLEYLANHDPLTALPNRALLYRRIDEYLEKRSPDQLMALMLIDLDRFKEINDTLGHLAGDKVLKQLGPRLEAELGITPGIIARLGGDEFAICLPQVESREHAVALAQRFFKSICQVFTIEGFQTEISASIGISLCPDQASDVSTLMRFADVAMYHAKTRLQGVAVYNSEHDPNSPKRLSLMGALGRAIREGELTLFFQPKVDLNEHALYGFEALIRWNHPELGFIPPSEFVPIAEMSNMIAPLTRWVLEESIRYCKQWLEQGVCVNVAINLSARNLMDENIIDDLKTMLDYYNVPGEALELEITESAIMSDPARAQIAIERINALGVRFAIDDYGTGYSSLAYLKRLPVQTLKIDLSFVRTMMDNEQDRIIVNSTINLAHNLGLQVVAEGVETQAIYNELTALGCDLVQGYHVAKPMPGSEIESWIREDHWELRCQAELRQNCGSRVTD